MFVLWHVASKVNIENDQEGWLLLPCQLVGQECNRLLLGVPGSIDAGKPSPDQNEPPASHEGKPAHE